MSRIIVRIDDANMAANVGGAVLTSIRTFLIEAPEIEHALNRGLSGSLVNAQIIGAEIVESEK